jgi:integrase
LFKTRRDALARKAWVTAELAALRVPDIRALEAIAEPLTVDRAADRWLASRRDVREGTRKTYDVALGRLRPRVGTLELVDLTPARVNELVEELVDAELERESIRKTLSVLAMIVDHEAIEPNPVRSPLVKLPRRERKHVVVPPAEHVLAIHRRLPEKYRLPLVVLEATGMCVGELELLTWDDVDEPRGRWRCGHKTEGSLRWVTPPAPVFEAVLALRPNGSVTGSSRACTPTASRGRESASSSGTATS